MCVWNTTWYSGSKNQPQYLSMFTLFTMERSQEKTWTFLLLKVFQKRVQIFYLNFHDTCFISFHFPRKFFLFGSSCPLLWKHGPVPVLLSNTHASFQPPPPFTIITYLFDVFGFCSEQQKSGREVNGSAAVLLRKTAELFKNVKTTKKKKAFIGFEFEKKFVLERKLLPVHQFVHGVRENKETLKNANSWPFLFQQSMSSNLLRIFYT